MNDDENKKCSQHLSFDDGSCIALNLLIEMAIAYNKEYPKTSISLDNNIAILNPSKYKRYLLKQFENKFGNKCTTQKCWLKQDFIRNLKNNLKIELQKYTFRPEGPSGKFEWLNTLNINDVLEQSEKKYKDFKYLGTVPIDFNKFDNYGFKNINFDNLLSNGKTKIGAVFNLDRHDQSGSHWVGLYSDISKGQIYFFDSYGLYPHQNIRHFMRKIALYCIKKLNRKSLDVSYNATRHQYGNSECGVYSINFIKRLLRGDTFEEICLSKTPDYRVNKCRNVYFK
jgi:hypothetical protein